MLSIGRNKNGEVVEEVREHPAGPVVSRTVHSKDGSTTSTSNGRVGIQSGGDVNGCTVRMR